MTDQESQVPRDLGAVEVAAAGRTDLGIVDFTRRVVELKARAPADPLEASDDLLEALGALDVAQEELRVADEELQAQQRQIAELLAAHESEVAWRERLDVVFPLALLRTRRDGAVVEANRAAQHLLGLQGRFLVGKPLVSLVVAEHHSRVRDALTQVNRSGADQRIYATITPRGREPVAVTAVASADGRAGAEPAVRWALLTESHEADGGSTDDVATAAALAQMCGLPVHRSDGQATAGQLAVLAQQAIPRAAAVSITLGDPEEPELLASDRVLAQQVDGVQQRVGQGPCVDAFHSRAVVTSGDVRHDHRWPRLSKEVEGLDVAGVVALPISRDDRCLGVLNVYAHVPRAFDDRQVDIARLVAQSVSAVLHTTADHADLAGAAENLERALTSRAVIDQAKGIIMARYRCTPDDAFRRLSVLSQRSNVKLRDIAQMLVDDMNEAPLSPPSRP